MTSSETHVIVGASLAGAKAAETLREEGFDGRVVLIGSEEERPWAEPANKAGQIVPERLQGSNRGRGRPSRSRAIRTL
jgi:3-phenylpropionate/trans-cinnamate dioxygenase ferredoxin reductase subunit